eukprot:916984-Pelagomonas_calceolata.AAC.6
MGSAGGAIGQVIGLNLEYPQQRLRCRVLNCIPRWRDIPACCLGKRAVLLSTHVARNWGAHADPVVSLLHYCPFLRTKGGLDTFSSAPLISTGRSQV